MPFERLNGAFAFLSLIPLIILYLRRPKPSEETIPSLMFFMRERGSTRFHSFMQQLMHNFLLLLQFAILSLLAFSLMGFFAEVSAENAGRTVIVLDVSGSMQAAYEGSTRFEHAVSRASELAGGRVSIVLAANVPRVVLDQGSSDEARKILSSLKPLDTSSNLGDAIIVAKDLLKGKGEVIVLSDFIATEGLDPFVARSLISQNAFVRFINLGGEAKNVGIIGLEPGKASTTVAVKNFDDSPASFNLKIVNGNSVKDEVSMDLGPRSVDEFSFDTLSGKTEIKLDANDNFKADNTAFLSVPANAKIRTLLITNGNSGNLRAALSASPVVSLDVARPPVIGSFDYDVIVLSDFDPSLMLPGFYRDIERAVSNGSSLIVAGQENLASAGIKILPVKIVGVGNLSRSIVNVTNYFTDGIDFGINERFLRSVSNEGSATIVSADDSPLVVVSPYGQGTVVYYGILDQYSTFKTSPGYPQFWSRLLSFITNTEDLSSFNFPSGRIEIVSRQNVDTPFGSIKTDRILFDKSGFYTYGGRVVAVNMLNARESDVRSDSSSFNSEVSKLIPSDVDLKETRRFESLLALVAVVLLFIELLYVKFRGDL